jgi:DCN1-like protein 1/2
LIALGLETAQVFWGILLPHGFDGGALTDRSKDEGNGWQEKYNRWWSEFLSQKGGKGVSKDTWIMVNLVASHSNILTVATLVPGLRPLD